MTSHEQRLPDTGTTGQFSGRHSLAKTKLSDNAKPIRNNHSVFPSTIRRGNPRHPWFNFHAA